MSEQEKQLTYRQSMDEHAREYLTRVLKAAGGERQRAAELAGLNRTHLQSLISRYELKSVVPFDPKARGRRKPSETEQQQTNGEDQQTEAPRSPIQF